MYMMEYRICIYTINSSNGDYFVLTTFAAVKSASSDDTAEDIWNQLANSVITTSNFFINYVIYRTLAMGLLRIFFPGAFIVMLLIKWFRLLPSTFFIYLLYIEHR